MDVLQLKQRLQLLTLGIGGVGVVSAYFSYSPEIAARYEFICFLALSFQLVVELCMRSAKLWFGYLSHR